MRVVFFGTPQFAVPSLEALLSAGIEVVAVVTQPDRAQGRSRSTLVASPVKQVALAAGLNLQQPSRPRGDLFSQTLHLLEPDLGVVVAYGHLIPPEVLEIPSYGMINVHASILPRWRGAAPIQWAILSGDQETGISIMQMDRGLDTGPVWLTRRTPITASDTAGTLTARLADLGAEALLEALPRVTNEVNPISQAERGVTLAGKINRQLARLNWNEPAQVLAARIKAMDPIPGAWCRFGTEEIKCFGAQLLQQETGTSRPGVILQVSPQLLVATVTTPMLIAEVQPSGKRRMNSADWARGHRVKVGDQLE